MKNLLLGLAVALAFESCKTNSQSAALTETFTSDSLHFTMSHPSNWEAFVNPVELNTVAFIEKKVDSQDSYKENIVCWMEEMPLEITDSVFFQASITELKISNPQLQIKKLSPVVLGDHTFSSFTFDYYSKDSNAYEVLGYCMVHGKRGYNFACNSEKKDQQKHHPIFKKMLSTFKPL
ncbi:MAG: hypothetical protein IPJ31_13415 [Bacteroidetes bacterium]|nr:hypothetical protein [Bacteroidota bacterium]